MVADNLKTPRAWLARCLGPQGVSLESAYEIGKGSGCHVWDCLVEEEPMVLKVYAAGFDDYSRLGPANTVQKHALALTELPALGVPTPRCLGWARAGNEAALVMEKMAGQPWSSQTRVEAARVLAGLHLIELTDLSNDLAELVSRSTPNRGRIGEAPGEPPAREQTLQHGDYFSVNIIATEKGVCVLDWDLLALGDPMWDLGFLLEADRNVGGGEAEAVIEAYGSIRAFDQARLRWQRECWRAYWAARDSCARAG